MPRNLGTRTQQLNSYSQPQQGEESRFHGEDPGMTKYVSASITFASAGTATGAAATFPTSGGFTVGDPLLVEGTNLNNGFYTITGMDATSGSYLNLDPAPKSEGPLTAILRTP